MACLHDGSDWVDPDRAESSVERIDPVGAGRVGMQFEVKVG